MLSVYSMYYIYVLYTNLYSILQEIVILKGALCSFLVSYVYTYQNVVNLCILLS